MTCVMRRIGFIESMPSDFLRVMGKVLLLSSAGMVAAFAFGGASVALGSVLGVLAAATAGTACLVASSVVHRRTVEACYSDAAVRRPVGDIAIDTPARGIEATGRLAASTSRSSPQRSDSLPDEDSAVTRFVEQLEAERELASGTGRVH